MRIVWELLLLTGLVLSCSKIDRNSSDLYYGEENLRHGIVPITDDINVAKNFDPIDESARKRGEIVYKQNCLSCHGAKGLGNGPMAKQNPTPPANLAKTAKEVPRFKFYMMISRWVGKMPGWKSSLSEKDVDDLEHYIRSIAQ